MKMNQVKGIKEAYELVYETEYYATMDEGWTIDNDSLEAKLFLELSEEGKQLYAMQHAKEFATEMLGWTTEKFESMYGDLYDEVLEAV